MNSIERVKAAIHFENPDKVPVFDFPGDMAFLPLTPSNNWQPGWGDDKEIFPHDSFGSWKWQEPDWVKNNPKYCDGKWQNIHPRKELDEWGRNWNMSAKGDIGHPGKASLPDWSKYEEYMTRNVPEPNDRSRYSFGLNLLKSIGDDKYRMVFFPRGVYDTAAGIRGFTNYLVDHKRHPLKLKRLLADITDNYVSIMKNTIKFGIKTHGFFFYDDLGEQSGPFFGVKTFNKFYEPVYRTLIDEAHNLGCELFIHCCGKVDRLLPSFIDWGLDVIQFDSPRMNGYQDLQPYRGKISMWGSINIQSIYPFATPEDCEREVWHMVRNLGTKKGGFGAYFYPQPDVIRVPKENINAFREGLKKYGDYSKIPSKWWDYPVPKVWKDEKEKDIVPPLPPL